MTDDRPGPLMMMAGWSVILSFGFFWALGIITFIGWVF